MDGLYGSGTNAAGTAGSWGDRLAQMRTRYGSGATPQAPQAPRRTAGTPPAGITSWQELMARLQSDPKFQSSGFGKFLSGLGGLFGGMFPGSGSGGAGNTLANYSPTIPAAALKPVDLKLQSNLLALAGGGDPYMSIKDKKKKSREG